ncbi:hypothetical protein Leryth_023187 [Lithospermum erythrorhizon]|nr:hypothetical protein Leryth_023187 [Lithospermum erythrorhizon]
MDKGAIVGTLIHRHSVWVHHGDGDVVENDGTHIEDEQEDVKKNDRGRIRIKSKICKVVAMVAQAKMDEVLYKKKEQMMSMTGFGGILKISKWTSIRTNFVKWVTDNWETDTGPQIRLSPSKVLKITQDDVHRVYHLPRGDKRVDISQCTDDAIERLRDELGIGGSFSRMVHYNVLEENLLNPNSITSWTKTTTLYIIYCLLCPVNGNNVDLRYASILQKLKYMKKYNWCQHVLEHTTKGITVNSKLNPMADFHFLLINYLERMGKQCRLFNLRHVQWKRGRYI